jgi:hypothetical protein
VLLTHTLHWSILLTATLCRVQGLGFRLRSNCGNIFCGKILVPVNDRVFAKNVSQIFRTNRAYLSGARRAEKSGKQIPFLRTNLKKAFFKFEPI